MALQNRIRNAARALLGISAYSDAVPTYGPQLDDANVEKIRETMGGQIQRLPVTQSRWLMSDLESAWRQADSGSMSLVGQLWRIMKRDGYIGGLTKTRTAGLVALPKRFRGDPKIIEALTAENETRSVFDEMFPPQELSLLAGDGIACGIGVAELVPVTGRDYPVLVRLDPEYLWYRWNEGRWYFMSVAGALPVTPGDGRWVLHTPGGRLNPWQSGLWPALGRAFIMKEHALLHRMNYSGKLANPARVAYAPTAGTEEQRQGLFQRLLAWGLNTVIEMPAGYDAKILESNGKGYEVFGLEVDTADRETMIALAGQFVTVTGGTGFANADIHQTIRADLIKETADALSYTLNTQGIPPWVYNKFGPEALKKTARVEWDIAPPVDRKLDAEAMSSVAKSITDLKASLESVGQELDATELINRFRVPVTGKKITPPEPEMQDDRSENVEVPPAKSDGSNRAERPGA